MAKIKNIVFDLGGVFIDLDHDQAVRRFKEIGVEDAEQLLDPYEQKGCLLYTSGPVVRWRGHANLLFTNWLNYYVYQATPFNIEDIKNLGSL